MAEIETSNAVLDVVAPEPGYLLRCAREGDQIVLVSALAYLFETSEALDGHAARLADATAAASESSNGVRATAPAIQRAAELGVDLALLPGGDLVTLKMVEAAAGERPAAAPPDLPLPLDAPSGVERIALIGAGLGATQVADILAADPSKRAVAIVDDDQKRWGGRMGGVPSWAGRSSYASTTPKAASSPRWSASAPRFRLAPASVSCAASSAFRSRTRSTRLHGSAPRSRWALGTSSARSATSASPRVSGTTTSCPRTTPSITTASSAPTFSTGPGCVTSGLVRIGDRARFGTGIFVEPHVEFGPGVQVASGAVIVSSVPAEHAVKRRVATMATVAIRRGREP